MHGTPAGTKDLLWTVDPLNFLRCCTFRVTCAITFGIPVHAFSLEEIQDAVNSVNGYFKVLRLDHSLCLHVWCRKQFQAAHLETYIQCCGSDVLYLLHT